MIVVGLFLRSLNFIIIFCNKITIWWTKHSWLQTIAVSGWELSLGLFEMPPPLGASWGPGEAPPSFAQYIIVVVFEGFQEAPHDGERRKSLVWIGCVKTCADFSQWEMLVSVRLDQIRFGFFLWQTVPRRKILAPKKVPTIRRQSWLPLSPAPSTSAISVTTPPKPLCSWRLWGARPSRTLSTHKRTTSLTQSGKEG